MTGRLAGKRALIFGGGTGIGLGCAEALVREGAAVFISGRRNNVLAEAAARLGHDRAGYAAGDASVAEDVQRVSALAAGHMGGVDTLVISAGAGGRTPVLETTPEQFQQIMDQNLRPVFFAVRFVCDYLLAAGGGSIIAISSMYGLVGQRERVAYCGAKAGVIGMVKSMALDLAEKKIRVNAICPGFVETPLALEVAAMETDPEASLRGKRLMHPIPRGGTVEEMGELAVYLASDASAFMTGQAIAMDGGYTSR